MKKLLNSNLTLFLDQAIISSSNFLTTVLMARFLSLDDFGLFSLLWLALMFIFNIHLSLIVAPFLNFGSKLRDNLAGFVSTFFFFELILVLFIIPPIIGVLFSWGFNEKVSFSVMLIFLFFVAVYLLLDLTRRFFVLKTAYLKLVAFDFIVYIGQVIIPIIIKYFGLLNILSFFIGLLIFDLLVLLIWLLKIPLTLPEFKDLRLMFLKTWNFSKWLLGASILQWVSNNAFSLFTAFLLGSWVIGVIRVMQNIMGVLHVFYLALENILPRYFYKVYIVAGFEGLSRLVFRYSVYALGPFLILFLMTKYFSEDIVYFFYGSKYEPFSYLLCYFVILYFLIFVSTLFRHLYRVLEETRIIFYSYLVSVIVAVLTVYPLIKTFGITGIVLGLISLQFAMLGVYLGRIILSLRGT